MRSHFQNIQISTYASEITQKNTLYIILFIVHQNYVRLQLRNIKKLKKIIKIEERNKFTLKINFALNAYYVKICFSDIITRINFFFLIHYPTKIFVYLFSTWVKFSCLYSSMDFLFHLQGRRDQVDRKFFLAKASFTTPAHPFLLIHSWRGVRESALIFEVCPPPPFDKIHYRRRMTISAFPNPLGKRNISMLKHQKRF